LFINKKLNYRKESAHLTSLYYTVQKAFRYVEPFKGVRIIVNVEISLNMKSI